MKIQDLYHAVRKFLFEVMLFFFLQSLLLVILAVVIVMYPYSLNLLVALGFFFVALVGLYVMIRVGMIFHEVKKVKMKITGKK